MYTVLRYTTEDGREVVGEWLRELRDERAKARILARIARLKAGNFGDCKPVRESLAEMRVDHGPGYRVYFSQVGRLVVLLLCAGDKRTQSTDIERALDYLSDFRRRAK